MAISESVVMSEYKFIRKVKINNFRSLKMDEPIEIKRLTLFFGKNGSGKSSFLKALKFVGKNLFPIPFGESIYNLGNDIDLGNYKDIVQNNDISKNIQIEYNEVYKHLTNDRVDEEEDFQIKCEFKNSSENKNLDSVKIFYFGNDIVFEVRPNSQNTIDKNLIELIAINSQEQIAKRGYQEKREGFAGYPNKAIDIFREVFSKLSNFSNKEKFEIFLKYIDILPFISYKENLIFSYYNQLIDYLDLNEAEIKFCESWINLLINFIPMNSNKFFNPWYISPIREKPKSRYILENNKFQPQEYFGILNLIDHYSESSNPYYPDLNYSPLEFINSNLQLLGLGQGIQLEKNNGIGRIFLIDNFQNKVNLSEASSGLQQILPIISASSSAFYRYEDWLFSLNNPNASDIVFIEQPELHLHPSLQGKLTEFLTKGMSTYVVETHSEHIIRKIQVLIAQEKLKKENVAVYYFDKNEKSGITTIKEIEIEDNGFFKTEWPHGFFDEASDLAYQLLEAQIARKN